MKGAALKNFSFTDRQMRTTILFKCPYIFHMYYLAFTLVFVHGLHGKVVVVEGLQEWLL